MASQDSDDEELKAAIAMSLSEQQGQFKAVEPHRASSGLLGLDRKAMEAERLARMASKRPRSISPPPLRDSRKALKLDTGSGSAVATKSNKLSDSVQAEQQTRKSSNAQAAIDHMKVSPAHKDGDLRPVSASPPGSIQYPTGIIKRTWWAYLSKTPYSVCGLIVLCQGIWARTRRSRHQAGRSTGGSQRAHCGAVSIPMGCTMGSFQAEDTAERR